MAVDGVRREGNGKQRRLVRRVENAEGGDAALVQGLQALEKSNKYSELERHA